MQWGLTLQGIRSRTFEELPTRAHEMEVSVTTTRASEPPIQEPRKFKDRQESRKKLEHLSRLQAKSLCKQMQELLRTKEAGMFDLTTGKVLPKKGAKKKNLEANETKRVHVPRFRCCWDI